MDCSGLWKFIKKRTLAYLLPWGVWTIVVRGLIFGQSNMLNIKNLLWHMDNGYWFLVTLNFAVAVILSCTYIRIIESNKLLNKILYWK